ncbi:hypothetical protein CNMCM8812_005058 [Aspergillus fumigatus]|nr:hypothetical protein CNMCM8812_005058 [Aspergillus fumigatus]KAH1587432.1 hypothetical protein KXX34_006803 [Aspergillus fumigatus]KAH2590161.1 hypothetical protein KXW93_005022 [Aspergillus fumigatus]
MFSAAKLRGQLEPAFCMVCGLSEGRNRWLKAIYCTPTGVKVTNPRQDPWYRSLVSEIQNGTDVYLFHEQPCWDHLLEHFGTDKLHLASLFEALERLPLPRDYTFPSYASLPGRIGLENWVGTKDDAHEFPILPGRFPLPSLDELMRLTKGPPKHSPIVAQKPVNHPMDGFGRLSFDILVIISSMLPTKEALDLRLVTRAAIPLFASSQFWKTRFAIDRERGFLLPIVRKFSPPQGDHGIDWRLLYHCTARLNCSDWFEIEILAWETLRWLRDTASAIRHESPRPPDFRARQMTREKYARKQRRGPFDAHIVWPYPGVRVTMDVVGLRGIVYLKDANGIHGIAIYHGGEDFDEVDDTLHVGLDAHGHNDEELVAYSVSLDKVEKVIAVVDNRKMIDLGISGTTTKRSEYFVDEWDDVVDRYKQDNAFLLKSM